MRGWTCLALIVIIPAGRADDPFPARTGPHLPAAEHTHERAGTATPARVTAPGIQKHDGFGLVNGMTFGSDSFGFGRRPGRIFPGLWPSKSGSVAVRYQTDGPIHVPDPIAAKPFRKAVIEAKHDRTNPAPEGHR